MFLVRTLTASTCALCLTATAGFADLTAEQVWQDWQSYFQSYGYEVQGQTAQSGDTLTVDDLALRMEVPEDGGTVALRIGQMQLVERSDGSVAVLLPASMPMAMDLVDDEGQQVSLTLQIAQQGLEMLVSGDPEAMEYVYSAQEVSMTLTDLMAGAQTVEFDAAQLRMANLDGRYGSEQAGDLRAFTQQMTAGPLNYELDFTDPDEGGRAEIEGTLARISTSGEGELVKDASASDMAAALRSGLRVHSEVEYEDGETVYKLTNEGDVVEGKQSSETGTLTVAVGPDGLRYGGEGRGVTMEMTGSQLPFPVTVGMERMGFDIAMPVIKSEETQDFALALDFGGFTMSDMIWSMFDPNGQLPRDPATIAVDLSGKGRLFFDLLDPEQVEQLEETDKAPGELERLTLNDLTVEVAGAKLTGAGAFTFDQTDLTSFEGMPAPEGAIDLRLVGGNGLLDSLIAMGFVPQEQATVVRMMAGMFARPGAGEDVLTSRIEVTEDGQVLANGQRLK